MKLLPTIAGPADLKKLSVDQLPQLAKEVREAICDQVAKSGGHLAPNLGVVDLTIAMHYVFDFGHDRLLWDVGHQCYTHKLLTGRQHLLGKLRQRGGMAGFPEPRESDYDLFSVGHAGTGISTAVGVARGDTLAGQGWAPDNDAGRRVAVVIGDASIVNGVAMEGLNNAGVLHRQFLVVLNDNGMSIAKPQGAVAAYFDRVRMSPGYGEFKKAAREFVKHVPGGQALADLYHRAGEVSKTLAHEVHANGWFEHFNLVTVGPVDGHDIRALVEVLNEAKQFDRPMVLHVKTVKGKGFAFAEQDSCTFHSPSAFSMLDDLENEGCRVELKKGGRSFTAAFGDAMADLMARDPKVVACTAAMPDGTGIAKGLGEWNVQLSFSAKAKPLPLTVFTWRTIGRSNSLASFRMSTSALMSWPSTGPTVTRLKCSNQPFACTSCARFLLTSPMRWYSSASAPPPGTCFTNSRAFFLNSP